MAAAHEGSARRGRARAAPLPHAHPAGERARSLGIQVDPYILDKWNVIRARSRLRKYLKRYLPVAAHSTGIEADLLLRWAARKVPVVKVAHTITDSPQGTRRRRPMNALMRRFDEFGMRSQADAVFVPDETLAAEVRSAGVRAVAHRARPAGLFERGVRGSAREGLLGAHAGARERVGAC